MKGSIEDQYGSEGINSINEISSDEVPAKLDLKVVIPPPADAERTFSYGSMTLDKAERGVKVNFSSGSRLQIDGRNLREGQTSVAVVRVCVANEDGTMLNDGKIELLLDESGQRLRKTGIFKELSLKARAHPTYKNFWSVDLTKANVTVVGVKFEDEDEVEALLEGAAALD